MKLFSDGTGKSYSSVILSGKQNFKAWEFTMREHLTTAGLANQKTSNLKLDMMGELNSSKASSARDVTTTINRITALQGKLIGLGVSVDDVMIISAMIKALPQGYGPFLQNWRMLDVDNQTLKRFIEKVLEFTNAVVTEQDEESALISIKNHRDRQAHEFKPRHSFQQRSREVPNPPSNSNRRSSQTSSKQIATPRSESVCNYCRKPGHWKDECLKLKRRREQERKPGAFVFMAKTSKTEDSTVVNDTDYSTWVVDSGCSSHMTPNRRWLHSFRKFDSPINIRLRNDSLIQALGSGNVITAIGKLKEVYYVPKLGRIYSLYRKLPIWERNSSLTGSP